MKIGRQFLVFILGGILCALLDVGTMQLLIEVGINPLVAATAGFLLGLTVNFLFHSRVTFTSTAAWNVLPRFLLVVALNYLLTIACVSLFIHLLGSALFGKIVSLPVVAINGFTLSRYWVFRS